MGVDHAAGGPRPVDARSRVLVRVATVGLVAVLTGVIGGAVWAAAGVDTAVQEIEGISGQGEAWIRVDRELSREESLGHAYLAQPSGDLRRGLQETSRSLAAALDYLVVQGEPDDAARAHEIKARHAQAGRDLERMLAAVDAGDIALAKAIRDRPVHPAYATLQYKTRAFADREQQEATEKLAELRRRQHELRMASFAAAAVGLFALGVFLLLINGYQRRLVRQALHDPLTGLPNRELFADRVGQAIRNADRELRPAALLLLDLDRFKEVNDTLGHHHGDLLLIQVGRRLAAALREADTVARLGGDEFAVLLPGATAEGAGAVADKLHVALQQPLSIGGITLDLDASIGIAVHPEHGNDPAELLQHADVAMYGAKQAHVGFLIYDPTVDQHSPKRLALLGGLRRALEDDQLVLHYQPKADLGSGQIHSVEALVRWQHSRTRPARPGHLPRSGRRSAGDLAGPSGPVGIGDHRERRHGRPQPGPGGLGSAASLGSGPGGGRLRHRLLLHGLPERAPGGRAEDRPLLRQPDGNQPQRRRHRAVHHRPRPQPGPAGGCRRRRDPARLAAAVRARLRHRPGLLPGPPHASRRAGTTPQPAGASRGRDPGRRPAIGLTRCCGSLGSSLRVPRDAPLAAPRPRRSG